MMDAPRHCKEDISKVRKFVRDISAEKHMCPADAVRMLLAVAVDISLDHLPTPANFEPLIHSELQREIDGALIHKPFQATPHGTLQ